VNVLLLTTVTTIEFAAIWWFITREFRKAASPRRFASWVVLISCLFFSPFLQIELIRQIVSRRETADALAFIWFDAVSLCALIFMFTLLRRTEKDGRSN